MRERTTARKKGRVTFVAVACGTLIRRYTYNNVTTAFLGRLHIGFSGCMARAIYAYIRNTNATESRFHTAVVAASGSRDSKLPLPQYPPSGDEIYPNACNWYPNYSRVVSRKLPLSLSRPRRLSSASTSCDSLPVNT